jgi:hypothetical protein
MILNKDTTKTMGDGLTLSPYYYMRYSGVHFDFDNMKIGFSGSHTPFVPKEDT